MKKCILGCMRGLVILLVMSSCAYAAVIDDIVASGADLDAHNYLATYDGPNTDSMVAGGGHAVDGYGWVNGVSGGLTLDRHIATYDRNGLSFYWFYDVYTNDSGAAGDFDVYFQGDITGGNLTNWSSVPSYAEQLDNLYLFEMAANEPAIALLYGDDSVSGVSGRAGGWSRNSDPNWYTESISIRNLGVDQSIAFLNFLFVADDVSDLTGDSSAPGLLDLFWDEFTSLDIFGEGSLIDTDLVANFAFPDEAVSFMNGPGLAMFGSSDPGPGFSIAGGRGAPLANPEPSSALLCLFGIFALAALRLRKA